MNGIMNQMNRKNIGYLLLGGGIILLFLVVFLIGARQKEEKPENRMVEIMADVPDAEDNILPKSKTEAYESIAQGSSRVNDYWNSCEEVYERKRLEEEESSLSSRTTEQLFGQEQSRQVAEPVYSNPYRETPQEREARHRRSREDAIRLAQEMNGMETEELQEEDTTSEEHPARIGTEKAVVKRSGIISSLDDGWNSDGISSLDEEGDCFDEDELHPLKCMFAKDSKIKNGQRVPVILQEDIVVSGTLVPRNTHIMASCRLSDRLELELTNIEIGGRILSLGYEAYDVDGNRGIYCPDVGTAGRQARSSGRNLVSSRLSCLLGGLARDVVSTGVSIIQSKDGEMTVSVPAGYTFFIIKKKDLNR